MGVASDSPPIVALPISNDTLAINLLPESGIATIPAVE
jgi:hypothetical protein